MPHKFGKEVEHLDKVVQRFRERESHCEFPVGTTVRVSFLPYNDRTSRPFGFGGSGVKRGRSL